MYDLIIYLASLVFVSILAYKMGYMNGWESGMTDWRKIKDRSDGL